MLSGSDSSQVQAAFDFGLNAGMAFQVRHAILTRFCSLIVCSARG